MDIKLENIECPQEKVVKMYEAVSYLIRKKDMAAITVAEITKQAGIGKGTAYEYFSSKEELISSALFYEYGVKIQALVERAFRKEGFRQRCETVMDWITENEEYNKTYMQFIKRIFGEPSQVICEKEESPAFVKSMKEYLFSQIDRFMQEGFEQGHFKETDIKKRRIVLLTLMTQYAFISSKRENLSLGMAPQEAKEYVYENMIKMLS